MIDANILQQAVDLFTGQVEFAISLVDRSQRNGLGIRLNASYSSGVRYSATTWNQEAPTGAMGLGWSLALDRIYIVEAQPRSRASALRTDRDYYVQLGAQFSRLVRTGTAADGTWTFGCENQVFWQISYDPVRELWRVVDENATTYIFGDQGSGRGTVDWGVAWGGWVGPSGQLANQASMAVGWSLSLVTNRFGDKVLYSYLQDSASVGIGGAAYTQATYLAAITGIDGTTVRLTYQPKNAVEYQDPHTDPLPPNAWQDRFGTRYLARLDSYAPNGNRLDAIVLGYAATFLGAGVLSKRLLTSIAHFTGKGVAVEPPVLFSYWGQVAGDGVSALQIFNATNGALYGALRQATLALGGTVTYTYAATSLQYSARSLTVASTATAASPRIYFSDDYALVTWLDGPTTVRVQGYVWSGRWIKTDIGSLTLAAGVQYTDVQVGTGRDCGAVFAGTSLLAAARDIMNPGAWLTAQSYTVALSASERGALAVGRDFACVLGQTSGNVYRYRVTGATWTADAALSVGAAGSGFAISATGAIAVAVAVPASGGATPVTLLSRTTDGTWSIASINIDIGGLAGSAAVAMGTGFAVVYAAQTISGAQMVRYGALWWDAAAVTAQGAPIAAVSIAVGATPSAPAITGATVTLLGRVHRFDGAQWNTFDPGTIPEPGTTQLLSTTTSADLIVRLFSNTSGQTADLLSYNALAGVWALPAGFPVSGTAPLAAVAPQTSGFPGSYAVVGTQLFARAANGVWSAVLSLPAGLSVADVATIRVVDNRVLLLQQGTGGASPRTLAYLLANGSASATAIALTSQQFVPATAGIPPLTGGSAFATFTGTYGAAGSVITLYRPLVGDVQGGQTGYIAATVTADNGYGSITGASGLMPRAIVCNGTGATVDLSGYTPRFNQVTVVPGSLSATVTPNGSLLYGFYNGLASTETPAQPWPSSQYTNALTYAAAAQGLPFLVVTRDATGATVASDSMYWQLTGGTLGQAGRSALGRDTRKEELIDGVTTVSTTAYVPETGFPSAVSTQVYNTAGTIDTMGSQFTYWWQIYDSTRATNFLSPVVQTTKTATPNGGVQTTVAVRVQTWRSDWGAGAGRWAPDRIFQASSATAAAFNAWQPADPAPANYLMQERVLARTPEGLPLAQIDALGIAAAVTYDTSRRYTVATISNCPSDPTMFGWFGCEPYESSGNWACADPTRTIWSFVTTADFHTGSQSLALPPATVLGPLWSATPGDQTRSYVFSCWGRTPAGFAPANGIAQWSIQPFDPANGQAVGQPIFLVLTPASGSNPTAVGNWEYFQATINLPALVAASGKPALGLRFAATNANTAALIYVDELRFMPLGSALRVQVYELPHWRAQAAVDSTGQSQEIHYDPTGRPAVLISPYGRVDSLTASSYSRQLTTAGTFLADFPNTNLSLATSGGSRYYDFHDGNTSDWTFGDASWTIAGGQLTSTGTGMGPIGSTATLSRYAYTYFGASVQVASVPLASQKITFGNGDVYMQWDQGAGVWKLIQVVGTTVNVLQTNTSVPFGTQWLFAAIDGWVLCFVNAAQLFTAQYTMPSPVPPGYGSVRIGTTAAASFDDVVVLDSPELSLSCSDGLGVTQQGLTFLGVQAAGGAPYPTKPVMLASGVLLDVLGRPAAQRLGVQAPVVVAAPPAQGGPNPWTLVRAGEQDYLRAADGTQLTLQQYLAGSGAGGYTYSSRTFETSPLSRATQVIAPRAAASDASLYTVTTTYGCSATVGGAPVTTGGKYRISTETRVLATDSQGVRTSVMQRVTRDLLGRVLMEQDGPVTGTLRQTGYAYDVSGSLSTIYRPNYYAPPAGSTAAAWVETQLYDFLGRLVSRQATDSGTTQTMYDSAGRPRFVLDAVGAAQSPRPALILYVKYDGLNRQTESGYIQDASYAWGAALQAKADVTAFPNIVASPSGPNDAAGAWRRRSTYDSDGTTFSRFLVGQLASVAINQNASAASPDTESYQYDAYSNPIAKTVVMPGVSPAGGWTVHAIYSGRDEIATLAYPALDANAPSVVLGYDRAGRVAAVGTGVGPGPIVDPFNPPPAPEQRWATFGYDLFGRLGAASYNNAIVPSDGPALPRIWAYDDFQRLAGIADPYFIEALTYDTGTGIGGASYYDGRIAQAQSTYTPNSRWNIGVTGFSQQFQYDSYGRLTSALNSLSDAFTVAPASTVTYDANGNVRGSAQGRTQTTLAFGGSGATASNQVTTVTSTVNAAVVFNTLPPGATSAAGWIWTSSNGGPSASTLISTTQGPTPQITQILQLAGGGLGHFETLRLATFLPSSPTYTVAWQYKTDPSYGQVIGAASWYAVLIAEGGTSVAVPLQALAAQAAWQTAQLTVNPATLIQNYGRGLPIVAITIELRNAGRNADGSPGPAVYLAQASVAAPSVTGGTMVYDADGSVTAAPDRGVTALAYDPGTRLTTTATLASGASMAFAYGADNRRSRALITAGAAQDQTVTITGFSGEVLATRNTGGTGAVNYYLHGPDGPFGLLTAGKLRVLLGDHLDSARLAVDATTGAVVSVSDYMPYGGTQRRTAPSGTDLGFTDQRLDTATGLYNYNARLYDPAIGRFYSPDSLGEYASPYTYVGNDPVNATDPSGLWTRWNSATAAGVVAASAVVAPLAFAGALKYGFGYATVKNPPLRYFDTPELQAERRTLSIEKRDPHAGASWTDDVLRGKTYDWQAYTKFEIARPSNATFCTSASMRWQNGTVLADGRYMYTLDANHHFNVMEQFLLPGMSGALADDWEQFRSHAQLAGGLPVYAAGRLRILNGYIVEIDNSSGHYRPPGVSLDYALFVLKVLYHLDTSRSMIVPFNPLHPAPPDWSKYKHQSAPKQPGALEVTLGVVQHAYADMWMIAGILRKLWTTPQDQPHNDGYFLRMRHVPGERPDRFGPW